MVGIKNNKNSNRSKMKQLLKYGYIIISLLLISCDPDDSLLNNEDVRDDLTGNWLVTENSSLLGFRTYEVDIFKDSENQSKINILNFYKMGANDSAYATISTVETNTLTIPYQSISGNIIDGYGTLDGSEINLIYYVDDGNDADTITANYSRDLD